MTSPCRTAVVLVFLVVTGCSTLGARSLPEVQAAYNDSLSTTQDTQFLLNIVRLRYRDTPAFLDVASLTTQQTMSGSMNFGASVPVAPTPGATVSAGGSTSMSVTPTTTFAPVRGDDYVKRLVTPISLQTVSILASSGWGISRVLQLTVDRVAKLSNAPSATGPTPDLAPDASRFIALSRAMRALQVKGRLSMRTERDAAGVDIGILHFEEAPDETGEAGNPLEAVRDLLELPSTPSEIRLTEDFTRKDPTVLPVRMRSLLGAIFYLSQAVEVPPEHEAQGLVTVTKDAAGRRFDWQALLDGIFRVHWSAREPERAAVKVKHRGYWFYVADDDLNSKSTFMLLVQLFNMQAGRSSLPVPLLTIPAGR
jgi:hypothetical protein